MNRFLHIMWFLPVFSDGVVFLTEITIIHASGWPQSPSLQYLLYIHQFFKTFIYICRLMAFMGCEETQEKNKNRSQLAGMLSTKTDACF